jgi:hypothetical protein
MRAGAKGATIAAGLRAATVAMDRADAPPAPAWAGCRGDWSGVFAVSDAPVWFDETGRLFVRSLDCLRGIGLKPSLHARPVTWRPVARGVPAECVRVCGQAGHIADRVG